MDPCPCYPLTSILLLASLHSSPHSSLLLSPTPHTHISPLLSPPLSRPHTTEQVNVGPEDPAVVVATLRRNLDLLQTLASERAAMEETVRDIKMKDNVLPKLLATPPQVSVCERGRGEVVCFFVGGWVGERGASSFFAHS